MKRQYEVARYRRCTNACRRCKRMKLRCSYAVASGRIRCVACSKSGSGISQRLKLEFEHWNKACVPRSQIRPSYRNVLMDNQSQQQQPYMRPHLKRNPQIPQ
nr:uncharacterized protein CTRU02_00754 [Colletotrichum truncatum]KAF6802005.1 hypothetical protein CTRU02_00754 [Colletotrichum truncatum]